MKNAKIFIKTFRELQQVFSELRDKTMSKNIEILSKYESGSALPNCKHEFVFDRYENEKPMLRCIKCGKIN